MPKDKCSECNQDHTHQVTDYPEGHIIIAVNDMLCVDGKITIPQGSFGSVQGHHDDGRAIIEFDDDPYSSGYTFHYPAGWIAVFDPTDRIDAIRSEIKQTQDMIASTVSERVEAQKQVDSLLGYENLLAEKKKGLEAELARFEINTHVAIIEE